MAFNFNEFMERYAEEIGGQFSEYDHSKSVIIVPLEENRFQAVLGVIKYNEKFKKMGVEFSSKVCPFSDDIDWIKYNNPFYEYNCFISQYNNPIIDLCLQTLCTYHIIANSSFSWWAAYLNKQNDKIIIAPKKWYANSERNTNDLIPSQWIRI